MATMSENEVLLSIYELRDAYLNDNLSKAQQIVPALNQADLTEEILRTIYESVTLTTYSQDSDILVNQTSIYILKELNFTNLRKQVILLSLETGYILQRTDLNDEEKKIALSNYITENYLTSATAFNRLPLLVKALVLEVCFKNCLDTENMTIQEYLQ